MMRNYTPTTSDFNLQRHLLVFMQRNPFLAGISRHVRKIPTLGVKTAGVSFDVKRNELVLWYNPLFMASLTDAQVNGILRHEFYHIVFRHLTARRREPHKKWNFATDMNINWLIWVEALAEANVDGNTKHLDEELWPLPPFVLRPGAWSWLFNDQTFAMRDIHPEEHAAEAILQFTRDELKAGAFDYVPGTFKARPPKPAELLQYAVVKMIHDAPGNMSSEWYFEYLGDLLKSQPGDGPPCEGGDRGGEGGDSFGPLDDHDSWDDLPDDLREKIENQVRSIIEGAVRQADQQSNGWGHMPSEICEMIRKSVSTSIDWKAALSYFIGTVARGDSRRSITVRDRKYGLLQPGVLTGHTAHIVMVIDQSGSVSNEMLIQFFAELSNGTRKVSFTILPFDYDCKVEDAWEWKKGTHPEISRVKCGGTNFEAPTQVVNDNFRAKGWEGVIFMTDGECSKPSPSYVKRAWIMGQGCATPDWLTDETVIVMEDGLPATGAWR